MKKEAFRIGGIPALLWGESAEKGIVAVHGNLSSKEDVPIEILAEQAVNRGYQVLSFDLPGHGERRQEPTLCKVQGCVADLDRILRHAQDRWEHCGLFANSMGAYFSLLACAQQPLEKAWFLSPVVDMQRMIENMMCCFQVTARRLEQEGVVPTPTGQTLYWDDYCYVKGHPVESWKIPTEILYGGRDELCERDIIESFSEQFCCGLEILPEAEHHFHTPEQLNMLREWLGRTL